MFSNYSNFLFQVTLVLVQVVYSIKISNTSTCPTLTSTTSTSVQCKLNNGNLPNCNNPVEGTIARLSCNPWFEQPALDQIPTRLCKGGRWDLPIHQCYTTCGLKTSKGVANIINGTNVKAYGDYPWQIGVYKSKDKEFICGGAIIQPHAILSAAHCFTDNNGNIQPTDDYIIAAGKNYRRFDDERDQLAQFSKILKIYKPDRFKAQHNLYSSDIVIIILKNSFTLSEVVQPVCINLKEERQQLLDSTGIVTGWGYTEEGRNLSDALKVLVVPLVPFNQCFNQVSQNFVKYITDDKICAGYKNKGTSICQGDSGGPLVYENAADDRYYVIGIVSTSPASIALTCDSNEYGTYTSVSHHFQFIRNSLSQHQPYESVECIQAPCSFGYIRNKPNCNTSNNFCNATSTSCEIPPNPPYTHYKLLGENIFNYTSGDFAKEYSLLEVSCHEGYALMPSALNISICINGIWKQSLTTCLNTCPSLISTETTVVKCSYNNITLDNCNKPVNGTIALLSCNPLYEEPNIQKNPIRICRDNRWNPPTTHCYPICGVKNYKEPTDVVNQQSVPFENHPWNVGIYSSATREFQCSGSIINQNMILTAAHCFTHSNGSVQPASNFVVAAGKYFRTYDDTNDQLAQYSNISVIHVPERYRGFKTYNELDIAVLILYAPFKLTKAVWPVCIELNEEYLHFHLPSNTEGVVTSWGYTEEEELLYVLKELRIQYIPLNKCHYILRQEFQMYLTEDKICGAVMVNNETSVCSGNSGEGVVFKNKLSNRYFVKGIVSSLPSTSDKKCDSNRYDLYTSVDHHINFVQDLVARNQLQTTIESIGDDSTFKENQTERNKETQSDNCENPNNPPYGKYKILGEPETNYKPGNIAKEYSVLEVHCHKGYTANPIAPKFSTCINGKWNQTPMSCLRTCPSLISTESTTVKCSYNNIPLENCINPVKGTRALLSCNPLYEEPNIRINPVRACRENRWDPPTIQCKPICGIKRPKGNANLINGRNASIGDYPWNVGIYKEKMLRCGGTIIDQNIILTAAHCIDNTDVTNGYLIAAGKYFSNYSDSRDLAAQYSEISAIHVPEGYQYKYRNLGFDIALLILSDPFKLSEVVQPACISLNEEFPDVHLSANNEGVVVGWGYTQEGQDISDVLRELTIPYVPYNKCYNELPYFFKKYLTQDKICGGYLNKKMSICNGDSGAGLAFNSTLTNRYFVKGIVSISPWTSKGKCDSNQYSLFTSVDYHIKFVRNVVALNQLQKSLECIGEHCTNKENQTEQNSDTNNSANCVIPLLHNTNFKILRKKLAAKSYTPGALVEQLNILEISCQEGYTPSPFAQNISTCINGKWNPSPTACLRTCPTLISTETTKVTCRYNNIPLANCANPVSGTTALLSCNPLYEEPNIQRNPVRLCRQSRWEPSATYCYPTCGIQHPKENSEIVQTGNVAVGDLAWHVGIYNSTTKKFICSGTIIDLHIVLTAAHCLTDSNGIVQLVADYSIAAGKYFRDYYEAEDFFAQYLNVLTIYVPEGYKGRSNMFAFDIGILILSDPFVLYGGVQPVCIDLSNKSQNLNLSSTNDGVVTGWGYAVKSEDLSDTLKEQIIPIVPFIKCVNESTENFRKFITPDKFCGGYGTTVCKGDSGGSLVLQDTLSGRYFVKGIVSTFATQELSCDSNKYSLYTAVDKHINFIRDIVALNQIEKSLECDGDDCTN